MKKSAKVCWAIGLLIFQMASTAISILTSYSFNFFISFIFECIPTIGAIILIFYDHQYKAPIAGNFTLLRAWTIGLIWIQPILSLIAWGSSGNLNSYVLGIWIGSCVFIIISTILLVYDGKEIVKKRKNIIINSEHQQLSCKKPINNEQEFHTVSFYRAKTTCSTSSYVKISEVKIRHGEVIGSRAPTIPIFPIVWYTSKSDGMKWNLYTNKVNSDISLYGRW